MCHLLCPCVVLEDSVTFQQWEAKLEVDTETVDDHREDSRTWREQLKEEKEKKNLRLRKY